MYATNAIVPTDNRLRLLATNETVGNTHRSADEQDFNRGIPDRQVRLREEHNAAHQTRQNGQDAMCGWAEAPSHAA